MKILEITTLLKGGSGIVTTKIATGLKKNGHSVGVVSTGVIESLSDWNELRNELYRNGIEHYEMNFFKREHDLFWFEVKKLATLIKKEEYDLIHVHAGVPAFAANVALEMVNMNIPIVATFHSWSPNRPEWMNIQDTWAFNHCEYVCFVSRNYMEYGKIKGIQAKSQVIYPGLWINSNKYIMNKPEIRNMIREKYNLPSNSIIISQLGEISERKGQIDLVYSIRDLTKKNEDLYILLIGNNTDYSGYVNRIKNEIRELNLTRNVIMTGWVEDPYEIVAASDLFIFPSYNEGLGIAILEAIALEIPTVFSCIEGTGDIKEVLREQCFGTFEPGNLTEITKIINDMINMDSGEKRQKVKRAANIISSTYNFNNTIKEYEELFLSILNK
ncbi:glycosyltransferase family 4 protein [Schinkia azotoformans]|uniref:glycosyltransferase family 4 protein n=1 Tax=Schinkia azotoformans TaxID=1454 RepID=UPI002E23A249|nr:glycosyltransferase family 4 protein [Schinkia azotoformans]